MCNTGSLQENTCSVCGGKFTGNWKLVCVAGSLQENTCSVCGGKFTGKYL